MPEPLRIIRLTAENFKRLVAVEIVPGAESVVRITGANEQGKSTVLDAIAAALGGEKLCPRVPLRKGQDHAEVTVDLGEYIVTRTFTPKGSYLTVAGADGRKYPSPQAVLDRVIGDLTFDPLAFCGLKPQEQRDRLLQRSGLADQLTQLDDLRETAFAERTETNREAKRLGAAASAFEGLPDDRPAPPDVKGLLAERKQREEARAAHDRKVRSLENEQRCSRDATDMAHRARQAVADAEAALEQAKRHAVACEGELVGYNERLSAAEAAVTASICPVTDDVDREIEHAQLGQRTTDQWDQREALRAQHAEQADAAEALSAKLDRIDDQKRELLANADLPIPGLGFDELGVTLNGVPLEQASSAEKLRLGFRIGAWENPTCKIMLVDDGEKLDPAHFEVLRAEAAEAGYQVWMASVDVSGQVGFVIEAGEVATVNKEGE